MRLTGGRFLFYVIPFCTILYLIIIERRYLSTLDLWICIGMVAVWPLSYWWFEFEPGYIKRHPNVVTETSVEYEQKQVFKAQRRARRSLFYRFITHPALLILCFTFLVTLLYRWE